MTTITTTTTITMILVAAAEIVVSADAAIANAMGVEILTGLLN